jgi:hypothetical protein
MQLTFVTLKPVTLLNLLFIFVDNVIPLIPYLTVCFFFFFFFFSCLLVLATTSETQNNVPALGTISLLLEQCPCFGNNVPAFGTMSLLSEQ